MDTDPFNPAALLAEMAQLAAGIARAWAPVAQLQARQAQDGSLDPQARDATKAFNGALRGLRHTLALRENLLNPAKPTHNAPSDRHTKLRDQIRASLEQTIRREAEPGERENLLGDMNERLNAPDFGTELAHLPLRDIVGILSMRLGITADFGTMSDHALAFDLNLPNPVTDPRAFDEALAEYIRQAQQSNTETNHGHCAPIQDHPIPPPNTS